MNENKTIIEVKDVVYEYTDNRALDHVSFSLKEGQITALVGPNGAGKSTLMRCIAALTQPLHGSISVCGYDVEVDPREVHRNLGYLSDFYGLYDDLTVEQSLYLAGAYRGIDETKLEIAVKLATKRTQLEELVHRKTTDLSRGQKQRVGIAMSIIHEPKMLILDEPASGLDPEARHYLSLMMTEMKNNGISILVSSHILSELDEYSTEILVIRKGKIVEHKPLSGLTQKDGKRFLLKLSAVFEDIVNVLDQFEGISEILVKDKDVLFTYEGSEEDQPKILKALIMNEVPVMGLEIAKVDLQKEYIETLNNINKK